MAQAPAYLTYLNLAEYLFTIVMALVAIGLFTRLLYFAYCMPARLKTKQISPSLLFNLVVHLAGMVIILPYHCYAIAQWSVGGFYFPLPSPYQSPKSMVKCPSTIQWFSSGWARPSVST